MEGGLRYRVGGDNRLRVGGVYLLRGDESGDAVAVSTLQLSTEFCPRPPALLVPAATTGDVPLFGVVVLAKVKVASGVCWSSAPRMAGPNADGSLTTAPVAPNNDMVQTIRN